LSETRNWSIRTSRLSLSAEPRRRPALVTNVDYNKIKLIGRLNGEVVQETTTDLLLFSSNNIVSYVSRYITLEPGDVIFTGTPGTTRAMKPGDVFEVEIPGVGTPRNPVVAEKGAGTK
jgi:2-keto-4-pentenoate hydratase/2-oxohepta-3-ene-1,7-dioic acid hydratase in catechol pathway